MPDKDARIEQLSTLWEKRGITIAGLRQRHDGTIVAGTREVLATRGLAATLIAPEEGGDPGDELPEADDQFELSGTLGEGGLGVVRMGRQRALRRNVAVKHLKEDVDAETASPSLMKEALVGGALSHPNVIPVHTLVSIDGAPAIVMRQVDGVSWSEVIGAPEKAEEMGLSPTPEWHVRVLMQVCNAIAFAHSRGVLHLDLKPENVMIGRFGEVYVVDWGLAAGFGSSSPEWLTKASDIDSIMGTPGYLAPEQAAGDGPSIGPHTDIYLLGATLHHAVTGEPPHWGGTLRATLFSAFLSEPKEYGPEVPEELAEILRRAMHAEPKERFETAAALRRSLEAHLLHREAAELVRSAAQKLSQIAIRTAAEEGGAEGGEEGAGRPSEDLETLFTQARFALDQALRSWPESQHARALLQELLERMFERALKEGRLDQTATYLADLPEARPELSERLAEARSEAQLEAARLKALEKLHSQLDLGTSREARIRFAFILAIAWAVANFGGALMVRSGLMELSYGHLFALGGALAAVFGPLFWLRRSTLLRNKINTQVWAIMVSTYFTTELCFIGGSVWGIPVHAMLALTPFLYTSMFVLWGVVIHPRMLVGVPTMLAAGFLSMIYQDHVLELIGILGMISVLGVTWVESRARGPKATKISK